MNEGLRTLELHPVLGEPPDARSLARFAAHLLAFSEGLGRLLERRIARHADREHPSLAAVARLHLRIHRPLLRSLKSQLIELGYPRPQLDHLEAGPRAQACLGRGERALETRDTMLAHIVLLPGLECLMQLLAGRGAEMAEALSGNADPFRERHEGHEELLFLGLEQLEGATEAYANVVLRELRGVFEDGRRLLDEWWEIDPPTRPFDRTRSRSGSWGTGDLPKGAA